MEKSWLINNWCYTPLIANFEELNHNLLLALEDCLSPFPYRRKNILPENINQAHPVLLSIPELRTPLLNLFSLLSQHNPSTPEHPVSISRRIADLQRSLEDVNCQPDETTIQFQTCVRIIRGQSDTPEV